MTDKRIEEIIKYVEKGLTISEIAKKLQISIHTVRFLMLVYKHKNGNSLFK